MFSLKNVPKPKGGKRYGLLPATKKDDKPKPLGKAHSLFSMDDDEEEASEKGNVRKMVEAEANRRRKQRFLKETYSDALDQDASVFQYDEVYEEVSSTAKEEKRRQEIKSQRGLEPKRKESRYIGNLMQQAQIRNIEKDRIYERKLQKEAEEEAKIRGEAEMKFVTSAYKEKLKEQKRWELEEKAEAEYEEATSATKIGMGAFYSSLLTKNIAMGGDVEKSARSAFTSGSKLHDKMVSGPSKDVTESANDTQENTHNRRGDDQERRLKAADGKVEPSKGHREKSTEKMSGSHGERSDVHLNVDGRREIDSRDKGTTKDTGKETKRNRPECKEETKMKEPSEKKQKPAPVEKVDKSKAIMSAKERYLARKREQAAKAAAEEAP